MICLLTPLLPLIIIFLGFFLASRYGKNWAIFTIVLALCCGCIVAFVVRANFESDYEYSEEEVYPAEAWHKRVSLNARPTGFIYREHEGLFVTTSLGEIQVSEVLPTCLGEGPVNQYRSFSLPAHLISEPMISLPPPPSHPLHQITFDIPIQFDPEIDTDILGASSYALYRNGEVWCTERVVQRGFGTATAIAVGEGFQLLYVAFLSFVGTFALATILTMICLEIYLRRIAIKYSGK